MNLYEIKAEYLKALDECIDEETGEVVDLERLEAIGETYNEKIENIICYIKNLRAEAKAIKDEEEKLKARRTAKEKKADSLSGYLDSVLGGERFEGARGCVSYRASVETFVDVEQFKNNFGWEDFVEIRTEYKPDKTKIKEALKRGETFEGAELVEKQNIQIK